MKQFIKPVRIINAVGVENSNVLLNNRIFKGKYPQVAISEDNCMKISKNGAEIILDYGKELCGGIHVLVALVHNDERTMKIRIRFGESLGEVNSSVGEKNASNHHSPRDFETILVGGATVKLGETGFRFVKIDFYPTESREIDEVACIKAIVAENKILSKSTIYEYDGKDERIKDIFYTAKRTVDLCSSSGLIWDGIKRDRLVWVGDLYPEILALSEMYGPCKEIERSLDFEKKRHKFENDWFCTLNTYNAWWVICVTEYFFRTRGKVLSFIKKHIDYINQQIELFLKYVKKDGSMNFPEKTRFFVDWPCSDCQEDVYVGARLIYMLCAKNVIKMYKQLNMDFTQAQTLYDYLEKGNMCVVRKKQVIGLKYLVFGEISNEEYSMLINNGVEGFSTFMSYCILSAIASKDKQKAIDMMKEYYGAMLDVGATTFWEDFDINWTKNSSRIDQYATEGQKDIHGDFGGYCYRGFRHSLCHAWSCGVNAFIKENCK